MINSDEAGLGKDRNKAARRRTGETVPQQGRRSFPGRRISVAKTMPHCRCRHKPRTGRRLASGVDAFPAAPVPARRPRSAIKRAAPRLAGRRAGRRPTTGITADANSFFQYGQKSSGCQSTPTRARQCAVIRKTLCDSLCAIFLLPYSRHANFGAPS